MSRQGRLLLSAVLLALAMLAAACGGGTSATDAAGAAGEDGKGQVEGTIRLSWWGAESRNKKTNQVADMFEDQHSGVTVQREVTDFGNYWNRLNVQAAGKNMPCVTQMQARQLNDYTDRKVLLPLDPMIDSGAIDVAGIPAEVLDSGRGPDGKLYMVPTGAAYDALMVNQTLAEQAGVGLPPDGYDWDFFFDWARRAARGMPEGAAAANLRGGQPNYFIAYTNAYGQDMFSADGKLGFTKELLAEYWTRWEELRAAGATNDAASSAEEPTQPEESYIAQGKVMADSRPGNSLTPVQATLDGLGKNQKLTTLPLPSGPDGPGNVIITSGFSVPVNCDNVPTAAAFINFWANDQEGARIYASDNGAVTTTKLLEQQLADTSLPATKHQELELYQKIVDQGAATIVYPPGYQAVFEDAFTRSYEDVIFGRRSIQEAVDSFFREANAGLG
jgi:multiple sugar transport system substrate-binding protein